MNGRRRALFAAYLLLAFAPGCQLFHSYRPDPILVLDAETKQPIAGATAHISYPLMSAPQAPAESSAKTGANGIARLQVAPEGAGGVLLTVRAADYLTEQKTLPLESVKSLRPAGWFENAEDRPPQMTIELYAGPRPTIELVLPAGYRGLVNATVQPGTDPAVRQRSFRYIVGSDGKVLVTGPTVLSRAMARDFQAVFADGLRLVRVGTGPEIGFWTVKSDEHSFTFLAGTRAEYEAMRRAEFEHAAPPGQSSGKGGGRRGSRGGSSQGGAGTGS